MVAPRLIDQFEFEEQDMDSLPSIKWDWDVWKLFASIKASIQTFFGKVSSYMSCEHTVI